MISYTVSHVESKPTDWSGIPELELAYCFDKSPLTERVYARVCWSGEAFHVQLRAVESAILARYTRHTDPVWTDSCLEMFFSPVDGDGRYFNFECNPNGAVCFGFGYGRYDRIRLLPFADLKTLCSLETVRTDDGWGVNFSMPEEVIRLFFPEFSLESGRKMHANFYKCGEDLPQNDERMWSPITNGNSDYHQSEFFGELILG